MPLEQTATALNAGRRRKRRGKKRSKAGAPAPAGQSAVPAYGGHFGPREAERLLWRAGFGPKPGEAQALANLGLAGAVASLTNPPGEQLAGPPPVTAKGQPISPYDAIGHDHLWWLDKMVRTNRPLVERMTLIWHDWFATSNHGVASGKLMIQQNELLRRMSLGSFKQLLLEVTRDPAMLVWLSGTENRKGAPNENYAREMMELFTLGPGRGYSERDVREQARALTGFRSRVRPGVGPTGFRFDRKRHDAGVKTIFGKRGRFDYRDSVRLAIAHRNHPSFFVTKLWSYFIPVGVPGPTQSALEALYVGSGYSIKPVVEAILKHPLLYQGPHMAKPPVVFLAGLLRLRGRGVDTELWANLSDELGQTLFYPPDVAGWDDTRWLDTSTWHARWQVVVELVKPHTLKNREVAYDPEQPPSVPVDAALDFWGRPTLTDTTRGALEQFALRCREGATTRSKQRSYPAYCQNALRILIGTCADMNAC